MESMEYGPRVCWSAILLADLGEIHWEDGTGRSPTLDKCRGTQKNTTHHQILNLNQSGEPEYTLRGSPFRLTLNESGSNIDAHQDSRIPPITDLLLEVHLLKVRESAPFEISLCYLHNDWVPPAGLRDGELNVVMAVTKIVEFGYLQLGAFPLETYPPTNGQFCRVSPGSQVLNGGSGCSPGHCDMCICLERFSRMSATDHLDLQSRCLRDNGNGTHKDRKYDNIQASFHVGSSFLVVGFLGWKVSFVRKGCCIFMTCRDRSCSRVKSMKDRMELNFELQDRSDVGPHRV